MIICPNPSCQAKNPDDRTVCSTCQTAIPHRYLWVVGGVPTSERVLAGRYAVQRFSPQVVLDTQPGLANEAPADLPELVRPYLFLASHPVNVPRPYALLPDGRLLLEEAAILETPSGPTLMPTLADGWASATPLRQLGWLMQVAQLWQPCSDEHVAGTLLQSSLCRVDGPLLKLLEVRLDPSGQPALLSHLGEVWQHLVETAHETVQPFLATVCEQLRTGQLQTSEQLLESLDRGLAVALPQQALSFDVAVLTDQGPTRQRNEDSCYPMTGTTQQTQFAPSQPGQPQLLMVCDGIGGHQGGDVASKLAVAVIEQKLKPLLVAADAGAYPDPVTVSLALESAICAANDEISQQNDLEARQARDRMGTTVVLALLLGPQLYLAHVGDSRTYRISARRCQQVTLDDDVAAREVRLGYGFYRSVAEQPGTGALVQALGMTGSASLYPNVQRFLLDEDSVFLLCSDGLSDSDRVEQFWTRELLPLVQGQTTALPVARSLVQIANTYNGHDNVTVGLLRVQTHGYQPLPIPVGGVEPSPVAGTFAARAAAASHPATQPSTRLARSSAPAGGRSSSVWSLLLGMLVLVGAAGGLVAFFFAGPRARVPGWVASNTNTDLPTTDLPTTDLPTTDLPNAATRPPPSLEPLTYGVAAQPLPLAASPTGPDPGERASTDLMLLPVGTLMQVLGKQDTADEMRWVQVRICGQARNGVSNDTSTISPEQVLPATVGWILESQLAAGVQAPDAPPSGCG
ncbi:MAG: protein phosphatase 2C domain-containing protein [Cyanobacteria bacterium P01_A01_bin.105]